MVVSAVTGDGSSRTLPVVMRGLDVAHWNAEILPLAGRENQHLSSRLDKIQETRGRSYRMDPVGPILMVVSYPTILRWVPQNRVYGFRIPATCNNKSVWYDANALSGRHLFLLGLLLVVLDFTLPLTAWSAKSRTEIVQTVVLVGLGTILIADWRTANRWLRERQSTN